MIPLVAATITRLDRTAMKQTMEIHDPLDEHQVRLFEEEFAGFVGCRGGVAVNSGTNALIVALRALNAPPTIMLPSFSCRALLDAVYAVGLSEPALCDNECDVANADFSQDAVDDCTIWPHMFGTAAAPPTEEMVGEYLVIEDITLSLGSVRSPEIAVCSFHRDKMITTGRGGIIVAQDQAFLERCRELAYYDQPRNGTYRPAFSFGMTAMQAALGRSQLRQLPGFIGRRKEIAASYTGAFSEVGIETPNPGVESVYFRYIIGVVDPPAMVANLAERGIEAGRGVNPPLHRLLGLPNDQFPGAEECFRKLLSVPVHPGLTDEQVGYIIEQVIEVCAP